MPLVSILKELKQARQESYALPLFNTSDMHSTEGILMAFEKKRASGIIGFYSGLLERPNAAALSIYIRKRAEEISKPVSLMLDHGKNLEDCIKAISYGFTDVMYDGSKLSLEENIENTRYVVRMAHAVGVSVEAELGHVGSGSDYQNFGAKGKGFTDPDSVETFVEETGVDFLAVAIGTAHGVYDGEPCLDLELLSEIKNRVDIPLALHGGSGCSEEQYRAAIKAGISKINIATNLFATAGKNIAEAAKSGDDSYFSLSKIAVDSFEERCSYFLRLFGASKI